MIFLKKYVDIYSAIITFKDLRKEKFSLTTKHFFQISSLRLLVKKQNIVNQIISLNVQVTHWQSPYMHAYFPALNSYPSLLGDMLADGINCLGFTWVTFLKNIYYLIKCCSLT